DMLKFNHFTIGWSWTSDYGNPDDPEDFPYLYAYSPYHNIQEGVHYPPTLITTADHDDRVVPLHSYKFAAALQEAQGGPDPILLRVYPDTGHGRGRSLEQAIEENTDILSFLSFVLITPLP
ncbi:MAG: prolyl oligopeptidase family serine peptidase, partial [Simkaniaceae bacterium]